MKHLKMALAGFLLLFSGATRSSDTTVRPLNLSFEENQGQAPDDVRFLARGHGYNLLLTPEGNRLLLRRGRHGFSLTTTLANANPKPLIRAEEKQAGKVHYLRGGFSLTNIPTYARVKYERVYPGIDLVYYGNQSQLEYDFVVKPGARPGSIAMRFDGAEGLMLDAEGNLILRANDSEVIQKKPVVYQEIAGSRRDIEGGYRMLSSNTVGFEIGAYDPAASLIIDPSLSYFAFVGGSDGDDDGRAIATDASGNVYIAGSTTSTNFQTASPFQPAAGTPDPDLGLSDAFVTKLNPAGNTLVYSTYLGGTNDDDANSIALDSSGSVIVVGSTASTSDFPTTAGAIRRTCNVASGGACRDAFIAKLNAAGSALVYATYLGGTGDDEANGVAVDVAGNAYVTGQTTSTNFTTTAGAFSTDSTAGGFVTKLSPSGAVVYSTYFGAGAGTTEPRAIAVDSSGNAYITGRSPSSATTGTDVFVTKLNATGTASVYSQFIRGTRDDSGNAIAVDAAGNAYVAGETSSIDFTTTSGVVQSVFGGGPAFRTVDAGTNWSATGSGSGITRSALYALAIASTTPPTLYAGADDEVAGGVFKSTNGGVTWTSAGSGLTDARVHALAADPVAPATIYAGTRSAGVFKTTDSGTSWSATPLTMVSVTALAVDPITPANVYAGTENSGAYKSTNGGASWTSISSGLPSSDISALVIDPLTPATLYAATGTGIYKTTNGGTNWTAASSGLFDSDVNALVLDPRNPNLLFAGTNSFGVFRSTNGGNFWFPASGGLPGASGVTAITIDATTGTFYAGVGEANAGRVYKSSNGIAWTGTGLYSARLTSLVVDKITSTVVYAASVGGSDAFVAKWNTAGSLTFSTYLGGYRDDEANAIAIDSSGNIYVAGTTSSTNFPVVSSLQSGFGGGSGAVSDAFVAKLDSSATVQAYASYLGGDSNDFGRGIAVDSSGNAYVVGQTGSGNLSATLSVTSARPGMLDAFVAKIADTSNIAYSIAARAGRSITSLGGSTGIATGYARIQPTTGSAGPSGLAIFSYRPAGVLLSEAAVPASSLISAGRIYAEISGTVNTGLALVNPNSSAVTLNFYFTNESGANSGSGSTTLAANSQTARFLTDPPFNSGPAGNGTFTFTSSAPVAAIAIRGLTNERGEFLMTTLPVADLSVAAGNETLVFPYFADGDGWTTQIVMVNPTDDAMAGSIQFTDTVTIAAQTGTSFTYSIPARSSNKLRTAGTASPIRTGFVRMVPNATNRAPSGLGIFSYRKSGITVTEAGVPAFRASMAWRLYAESSGNFSAQQAGSAETGIAIANSSSSSVTVNFELTTLSGTSTGLTGVETVPANGIIAKFLRQIAGFTTLPIPFQGVLRVSTASPGGISVVGLRGRYNERGDFLITTTQPNSEGTPASGSEQFFPHFADGSGYTTQFILFNGSADQSSSGSLRFFASSGQPLSLPIR